MYMRGFGGLHIAVYLITAHAYRSWAEDHPKGYVQRDEGLKKTNPRLAKWRAQHSKHGAARFEQGMQEIISQVVRKLPRSATFAYMLFR
jgi:hypothetical protein